MPSESRRGIPRTPGCRREMVCALFVPVCSSFPVSLGERLSNSMYSRGTIVRRRRITTRGQTRSVLRASANRSKEEEKRVKVLFLPEGIEISASPGEPLTDVARRAGVEIVESCGVGDCGTCEVLLLDEASGDRMFLKSCVTKVPSYKDKLVIDTVGDAIPPW